LDAPREQAGDPPENSGALIFRIPINRVNWTTSSFLIGTFVLTLTAVPLYLWYFGIDWFHLAVFAVLLAATGFSITLGYHRLFSHMTFRAKLRLTFPR
jgi:stearoyl-CoA desaturase (Delta-9 desaturase)